MASSAKMFCTFTLFQSQNADLVHFYFPQYWCWTPPPVHPHHGFCPWKVVCVIFWIVSELTKMWTIQPKKKKKRKQWRSPRMFRALPSGDARTCSVLPAWLDSRKSKLDIGKSSSRSCLRQLESYDFYIYHDIYSCHQWSRFIQILELPPISVCLYIYIHSIHIYIHIYICYSPMASLMALHVKLLENVATEASLIQTSLDPTWRGSNVLSLGQCCRIPFVFVYTRTHVCI